jgi:hypothetical protein
MKKTLCILLGLLFSASTIFAHALWIETPATGKVGQKLIIKVFYGEYADLGRDSVSAWYSDVENFSLWMVGPDEQKVQLDLTRGSDYFEASFIPARNGSYTLMLSHEAKDLGGTTKYHFLSSAVVCVGKAAAVASQNSNTLRLHAENAITPKVKQPIRMSIYLGQAAAVKKAVTVFSPTGWSKEFYTDEKGSFEFIPLWSGRYVIEVTDTDKTPGTHHGKDFKATWRGATYSLDCN